MEELIKKLKAEGKKILNLKGCLSKFTEVKEGTKNVVDKEISFRTQPKFLTLDDKGEPIPRHYDYLLLICGEEKLLVEVVNAEWFILTDDEDNAITHTEEIQGREVTWTECLIRYTIKLT